MNKDALLQALEDSAKRHMIPAGKAMLSEVVNDIIMESLQQVVEDSSNPYDDMLLAALKPIIEDKLAELLAD